MSDDQSHADFPILFTIGSSNRHDVVFLNPTQGIKDIYHTVNESIASSPNAAEALAKYSKNKGKNVVTSIKVKWAASIGESKLFPPSTVLTQDNTKAVLALVGLRHGKDILEVDATLIPAKEDKEDKEGEEGKDSKEGKEGKEGKEEVAAEPQATQEPQD